MSVISILRTPTREFTPVSPLRMKHSNVNASPASFTSKKSSVMSNKIALPTMDGINFENTDDIVSLEAQGNYTMLHFIDGRQLLICKPLNTMELALEDAAFMRIHRSATIHMGHIKQYIKGKGGYVVMNNGLTIAVSEGKRQEFLDALKEHFKF
jgi:two-component system, LytTR family, response regulator